MPRGSSRAPPAVKPGAALLLATLIAALLATAAAILIDQARGVRAATGEGGRLEASRMQAMALSEAALVALDSGEALALDGGALALPQQVGAGAVRLQEASGLVDLNTAPPDRLSALFVALGVARERAEALADRIADWRDTDDLKRLHGAEEADYLAADLWPPANRPFELEIEIARVLGVSQQLADCLAPYLTVDASWSYVDIAHSPPPIRNAFLHATHGAPVASIGAPIGQVVLITAEAPISDRAVYRLMRWVRLTGDPARPALVHRARAEIARANAPVLQSCAGVS
ncbi:MAG: general secretion pathway protein GspK [Hyphomonadaceae bacterium]|nr:general secretion pathway protein GspK [Hyphomonadaceae bacterium]